MSRTILHTVVALALAAPTFAQTGSTPSAPPARTTGTGGAVSKSKSPANPPAVERFMKQAAIGGMAEVELGKIASDKAANPAVKEFGQRMATDHGKVNEDLKELASRKNVTLPTALDASHKAVLDRLSKLSGASFDRAYMQEMLRDHQKDVNQFKAEARTAADADVKTFAGKALPTLEDHLKQAQTVNRTVGTAGTSGTAGSTKTKTKGKAQS